jgi:hypothetical protein
MRVIKISMSIISALLISAPIFAANPHNEDQVTICHYPPGNPGNAHTITVGASAVQTHISQHGDTLGACAVSANDCNDCAYRASDYENNGCAVTCGHLVK